MSRPADPTLPPGEPSADEPRRREEAFEDRRLAEHLRTLSRLAPGIAHDLRAPINAMLFNVEVLRESVLRETEAGGPPREARMLRYAAVLSEELQRLHQRLEVLFPYLQPESRPREALELAAALREIESLVVPTARKRQIRIQREEAPTAPLPGSPAHLRQALLQVALHALERSAAQGHLTLSGERTETGLRIRFQIVPAAGSDPGAEGLAVARALLDAEGASLHQIDDSVSPEPSSVYEVEFVVSRNATAVTGT